MHGGVIIYRQSDLHFKNIENYNYSIEVHCEMCSTVISFNGFSLLLMCVYRPPGSDLDTFFDQLYFCLSGLLARVTHVVLCGDFTINYQVDVIWRV